MKQKEGRTFNRKLWRDYDHRYYEHLFEKFGEYFKIGVSDEYILMRGDFPLTSISPSDFSHLCIEVFRRNEEARHGE